MRVAVYWSEASLRRWLRFIIVSWRMSDVAEYTRSLGTLVGDVFEEEVCCRLRLVFPDFQRIPRKPQGDAGLDGLSHAHTRAYCCYGPEQEPFKMDTKGLKEDILKKFRSDLRKLFELVPTGKTSVKHCASPELATVLAANTKLTNVFLVVSWFEDRRIVGPLMTTFKQYLAKSKCTYVAANASMAVWGPKDLATLAIVDEYTKFRIENHALLAKVKAASQTTPSVPPPADFDAKFDWLRGNATSHTAVIERLRTRFRSAWGAALVLDQELAATSVRLHEALESARSQASVSAELQSMQKHDPAALISNMRTEIQQHLGLAFTQSLGPQAADVADGEIARLIGECPIEWRR